MSNSGLEDLPICPVAIEAEIWQPYGNHFSHSKRNLCRQNVFSQLPEFTDVVHHWPHRACILQDQTSTPTHSEYPSKDRDTLKAPRGLLVIMQKKKHQDE
jgi:hypothetical protein